MENLIKDVKDSLFCTNLDILLTYGEIGIDSFIDNDGIIKEIPALKTLFSIYKTTRLFHSKKMLMNTFIFLKEFSLGKMDENKLKKYRESINKNPKKLNDELGRVLLILENNLDEEKNKILAKLFVSYINGEISKNDFYEFTAITDQLIIVDLAILRKMWKSGNDDIVINPGDRFRVDRLYSLALVGNIYPSAAGTRHFCGKILNEIGEKYCNIIFSK